MIPTLIISLSTSLLIILSILLFPSIKIKNIKIHLYWIISIIGAGVLLIFNFAPIDEVINQFISPHSINPIKILILFFSMTVISIILDEFGLFIYLANVTANKAKNNQYILFIALYILTSVLTIFTSNDIVILTITPFICFFAKRVKINPLPYLIGEFVAANTWSLMFIIGNPTNIYLATSSGIDFISYFKVMWLPTLLGGLVEIIILLLLFNKYLKSPLTVVEDAPHLENKLEIIIGLIHLLICLIFLIISSYINVEMWIISLIIASSLLIINIIIRLIKKDHYEILIHTFKRLPYELIPFFISMFIIVVALNYQGAASKIASILGNNNVIWVYGYSSLLMSNIINNIPMSILYSYISINLEGINYISAIYASIIGSNIGAFLTPIGALAGLMFINLINEYEIKFSFLDFIKYGVIIALPVISISLFGLYISLLIY